ncbi:MAG: hypothetical protein NTZ73_02920 [Candidatus Diapherotrites archaeon]|nr:hypothetical protein [Candidatus Diapherotrites archaeon]
MKRNEKAQGTVEYLIILAIIVVIALVVVTLLFQFTDAGRGLRQADSDIKWKSATPFAIINHVQSSANNGLTIVLKNNTASTINFVRMCVSGAGLDCDRNASLNVAPSATFTRTISLTTAPACTSGATYNFVKNNITIDYNNVDINSLREQGAGDLVGTCS